MVRVVGATFLDHGTRASAVIALLGEHRHRPPREPRALLRAESGAAPQHKVTCSTTDSPNCRAKSFWRFSRSIEYRLDSYSILQERYIWRLGGNTGKDVSCYSTFVCSGSRFSPNRRPNGHSVFGETAATPTHRFWRNFCLQIQFLPHHRVAFFLRTFVRASKLHKRTPRVWTRCTRPTFLETRRRKPQLHHRYKGSKF